MQVNFRILILTLFTVFSWSSMAIEESIGGTSDTSQFCDIWLGVIKFPNSPKQPMLLLKKTTVIPINLPDGGPRYGWGFF